jgi:hypothetical protein
MYRHQQRANSPGARCDFAEYIQTRDRIIVTEAEKFAFKLADHHTLGNFSLVPPVGQSSTKLLQRKHNSSGHEQTLGKGV